MVMLLCHGSLKLTYSVLELVKQLAITFHIYIHVSSCTWIQILVFISYSKSFFPSLVYTNEKKQTSRIKPWFLFVGCSMSTLLNCDELLFILRCTSWFLRFQICMCLLLAFRVFLTAIICYGCKLWTLDTVKWNARHYCSML